MWNGFSIIGKKPELLEPMIKKIEDVVHELVKMKGTKHILFFIGFI